jgi:hypothetical protein
MNTSFAETFAQALDFLLYLVPIAIPILLAYLAFDTYVRANRRRYFNSLNWTLVEIVPSPDIVKSPAAMELFLLALYQTGGESTWIDRWVKGKVRTWYSLELVSLGGKVRFYIWCESKNKKYLESQIYAQYPGTEVRDADDYAAKFNGTDYEIMATELALSKADPYPIKTYVDYELNKEQDEEYKIDPITPILEFFATLPENNYACIQIIVRAHKGEDPDPTKLFPSFSKKVDNWKETAKSEIKDIKEKSFIDVDENGVKKKQNVQTETQKRQITALDRSVTKYAFDTGIRLLYIAKKDSFSGGNFGSLVGSFKQFNSGELNSFKPRPGATTSFDYPWQDFFKTKVKKMKAEYLEAYQLRDYFWKDLPNIKMTDFWRDNDRPYFVLNTEELATIFHFPGMVAQTPSMDRVDSKKATPPDNLPI